MKLTEEFERQSNLLDVKLRGVKPGIRGTHLSILRETVKNGKKLSSKHLVSYA